MSNILTKLEEYVIILCLSAMTIVTFSQVIARYVFNSGAVWALELTTYFFAWMVLVGASYLIKTGSHIAVTALVDTFSPSTAKLCTIFAILMCMIFVIIMFIGAYNYVELLYIIDVEMEDMPIAEWKGKIVLPIGFGLMFVRLIEVLIGVIKNTHTTMSFQHTHTKQ